MENRKKFQEAVNTTTLSLVEKKELLCALFLLNETEQNEVRELITSEKNRQRKSLFWQKILTYGELS
jgi:hypothetical protein